MEFGKKDGEVVTKYTLCNGPLKAGTRQISIGMQLGPAFGMRIELLLLAN